MAKKTRTVSDNEINNGEIVVLEGILHYARLTKQIAGAALIQDQQKRREIGASPIDKPYTTITLRNPVIIPQTPGVKSKAELYVEEHAYQNKNAGDPVNDPWLYAAYNKSKNLPRISVVDENDRTRVVEVAPEGELANEQRVRIILRFYTSRNAGARKGVTFDHVIVMDPPIKYYTSSAVDKALANSGMVFVPLSDAERAAAEANNAARAAANPTPDATSMPAAQPVSAPTGNPFTNQTTAPAPAPAVQPAPAPTAEPAWVCSCGHQNAAGMNFCNQCGARRPDGGSNPYAPANTVDDRTGGICYTPGE